MLMSIVKTESIDKHRWSNGKIAAFQAADPGSTPGRCIFYLLIIESKPKH